MRVSSGDFGIKNLNRIKVMEYLVDHQKASRLELSQKLGFSMPTVFQIVNELIERGVIRESGEYDSTGGRRAKILTVCPGSFCVAGIVVSKNHIRIVLLDASKEIVDEIELDIVYEDTSEYYQKFGEVINQFLSRDRGEKAGALLSVGVVMPGTLDAEKKIVRNCPSMGVSEVQLEKLEREIDYPVSFVSTKYAVLAEMENKQENMIYLSLNDEIDGSAYLNQQVYIGDQFKSMMFGHMTIVPDGRPCRCGRKGCFDAYCSANALEDICGKPLETFFELLDHGDGESEAIWDSFLDYLSMTVANLRMIFDCNIILGGKIGGHLGKYLGRLESKILKNSIYEKDTSFVVSSNYRKELYAAGAARLMLETSIREGRFLTE
ncbi:MAG: ROK family transcriptional regulator [Lachnospiraceae bacterium]|nr:ROK family transcriptional regulator [Lachnospiraceae bacterium]